MYCGDETGAFIGDVGSHTARFGYGGEDCPKVVIPSAVYSRPNRPSDDDGRRGCGGGAAKRRKGRHYSAPVSLMRAPPDDCFSADGEGAAEVGFVPIHRSLNSNDGKTARNDADGPTVDADAWAAAWEHSYEALCVRGKGKHTAGHGGRFGGERGTATVDHPLLAVDSDGGNGRTRERRRATMLETLFESLSAPAAYIAPSPMLSSFAYGRQTSLVVDVGHSGSRVTPIVDGYCLRSGSVASGRGGSWLGRVQRSVLEGAWNDGDGTTTAGTTRAASNRWNGWGDGTGPASSPPCQEGGVVPRYLLRPRSEKRPRDRAEMLRLSPFHSAAVHEVMYEMMTSSHVLPLENARRDGEAPDAPFCGYGGSGGAGGEHEKAEDDVDDRGRDSCYALPDGTRVELAGSRAGRDLRRLPELLFSEAVPSFASGDNTSADGMPPLQQLVRESLTKILDVDLRKELSSNVVLVGGGSLFPALDKRLSAELGRVLPVSCRHKVVASKNSAEGRYAAWIGGSVLSSLGSFQQLWLSKKEYEECGALLGLQRFKN